jgi:hypothetical protein
MLPQSFRKIDGRSKSVALRIRLRKTHVPLLVNAVIKALIRHRRHGHTDLVEFWVSEHQVESAGSAATSPPFRDTAGVDVRAAPL